nr:MAG TPA: hypothetical protein [Caudoviricetes sp.]
MKAKIFKNGEIVEVENFVPIRHSRPQQDVESEEEDSDVV